jgi:hypothetical protein
MATTMAATASVDTSINGGLTIQVANGESWYLSAYQYDTGPASINVQSGLSNVNVAFYKM